MKKGFVLVAALLMLAAIPVGVHAQGLLGSMWPGSFSQRSCGLGPCDPCGPPLFDPPIFYVGWMDSNSAKFSFDAAGGGGQRWPLTGVWLGLAERINLNETCGVDLDGWVLIPSNRNGGEAETVDTTIPHLSPTSTPGVFTVTFIPAAILATRTWDTRPDWWYLDAAATYSMSEAFRILAGFRYEHFSTNFQNPSPIFGLVTTPDDTADATVNSYLPFVGLQSSMGGLNLRLIGFPIAPAQVTYGETGIFGVNSRVNSSGGWSRSYFLELFAEYSHNIASNMGIGAFFRWNYLHAQGNLDTEILPHIGSIDAPGVSFDRNTATIGGSFTLNFGSPF